MKDSTDKLQIIIPHKLIHVVGLVDGVAPGDWNAYEFGCYYHCYK